MSQKIISGHTGLVFVYEILQYLAPAWSNLVENHSQHQASQATQDALNI